MRFRPSLFIAPLLAGLCFAGHLRAQSLHERCDLTRRAYDNPFSDSWGYVQPRYAWHIEKATAGALTTTLLEHLHVPRLVAMSFPALVTIALHVRGIARHTYRFNGMDWLADAWMVSPAAMRPVPYLAGYALTGVCFASP